MLDRKIKKMLNKKWITKKELYVLTQNNKIGEIRNIKRKKIIEVETCYKSYILRLKKGRCKNYIVNI